jgi:hypothetical protein
VEPFSAFAFEDSQQGFIGAAFIVPNIQLIFIKRLLMFVGRLKPGFMRHPRFCQQAAWKRSIDYRAGFEIIPAIHSLWTKNARLNKLWITTGTARKIWPKAIIPISIP